MFCIEPFISLAGLDIAVRTGNEVMMVEQTTISCDFQSIQIWAKKNVCLHLPIVVTVRIYHARTAVPILILEFPNHVRSEV